MLVRSTAYHLYTRLILLAGLSFSISTLHGMTADNRVDPFPVFKTLDQQTFLLPREKLILKGYAVDTDRPERVSIALSPFSQNATIGKNACKEDTELGNMDGRWAMVGLLMGPIPEGYALPPSLALARSQLFPDAPSGEPITDPFAVDKNKMCGFFEIPAKYRRYGIRFNFEAQIIGDLGVSLDVGISDISLTACHINNLTVTDAYTLCSTDLCDCLNENLTRKNINEFLMCPYRQIMEEICYDIENFSQSSIEDIRAFLYWRHAYPINSTRDEWMDFLLVPFFKAGGTVAAGKTYHPSQTFAVPFGSQNHDSVGFTGGMNVDFAETVEFGGEAGLTHFFSKRFNDYHVPTSKFQSGIYPFKTCVNIKPGNNWHFTAKMNAFHFMGNLSAYFQYVLVIHMEDDIDLEAPNPNCAFQPKILEDLSPFRAQVANIGFNYDISPQISLGFLWQAPLAQHNTYRTTTIMVGFNAMF